MKKLLVSLSGGRTSAFMLRKYLDTKEPITVVFANTGLEDERTLVFVDRVSKEWKVPVVWVESVVHHGERESCTHRIVTFETASRNGEPYEEVIKKYGIPNVAYLHCTRELKANPIQSYLKSLGGEWSKAIGIRADEPKRLVGGERDGKIYPLAYRWPTTKSDVTLFWEEQKFDLGLLDYQGNCVTCFKKGDPKLVRVYKENPRAFDFFARMEDTYGLSGNNVDGTKRVFFRNNRSTKQIISIAELLTPSKARNQPDDDAGCSESCEPF
jgi:3'-phosphoadenosine 5'-phosphosulfate sulfotransferase (PAPS reductase)/FAD synthetase